MKRLGLGIGLFLLNSIVSAWPAEACYECSYSGEVCFGGICNSVYNCRWTNSLCSQCWENCRDTTDQGCIVSYWCQWTSLTPKDNLDPARLPWATAAP